MLNQQIRETIQQFRDMLPAELSALIEQGAGEISALDIVEQAKNIGDRVEHFSLNDQRGDARSLEEYLAKGPVVLTFYRGVWCPYCNLQLKAYGERLDEIRNLGANLVAITPEHPDAIDILETSGAAPEIVDMAVKEVAFDVLHDIDNQVAKEFGLVFTLPESHQQLLSAFGVDLERLTGGSTFTFPDPATYVVKPDGEISWAFVPNNYRKRAEVDHILRAIRNIKT